MSLIPLHRHPVGIALLALVPVAAATWSATGPLFDTHLPGAPVLARPAAPLAAEPARHPTQAEQTLHRFALNALLASLLDADTAPLRWADPALVSGCGTDSSVLVDGAPLEANATVPVRAFTLTWHLVDCMPLGNASMALTGPVVLEVVPGHGRLTATVQAEQLRIDGRRVVGPLTRPFEATMAYAALDASAR